MPRPLSPRAGLAAVPLALALLAGAGPAAAGIFDDDEARKAILDLRARVTAVDEAARKREAEQQAALQASQQQSVEQVQKGLLDLANQIEQLRAEVARLRGANEQLARDVAHVQRRQKDVAQGLEDRLRKVEPQKVSVDGKDFMADPEEVKTYEDALATLRSGDFERAVTALAQFGKRWPGSGYTDTARYWLGNALYGKRDYKEAIASFRNFIAYAPDHPRAPEALLAVANCQVEAKDVKAARKTLDELIKAYPKSEAAAAAGERLRSLK